jgi:ElaB/YqjD/DUF883 family membrane-anchored ribosome-binding protein
MNKTVDKVSDFAHEVVDKAADATSQAVDKISEKGEELKNTEERLRKEYSGYIRENPGKSLLIAAGVGFILSRLLSGR